MDRREARLALELARQWTREGLMPPASLAALERRHAGEARDDPEGESFGAGVLYALGGVLLGCAAIALIVLLDDNGVVDGVRAAPWVLLGWGALCAAAAFAIDLAIRRPRLGDAVHVAALVAIVASGFPRAEDLPFGFLAVAYAAGIVWYRRERFMVAFLALVGVNVALASILWGRVAPASGDDAAMTLWFSYAAAQVPLLVVASRATRWPWPTFSLAAATLLLAGTFVGFHFEVADDWLGDFEGDLQVYLALLMGTALGVGLALREKGLVLASAFVLAIDAIVFAFDVGEVVGGLLALLAVAGLLIWQAGALRRYLREG